MPVIQSRCTECGALHIEVVKRPVNCSYDRKPAKDLSEGLLWVYGCDKMAVYRLYTDPITGGSSEGSCVGEFCWDHLLEELKKSPRPGWSYILKEVPKEGEQ